MSDDARGKIDRDLLALLEQRAVLDDGSYAPERDRQLIDALARESTALDRNAIAAIWREVLSACRATKGALRVAYLGPAGTFSELAARTHFGASVERVPCDSFDEVFRATLAGAADFGIVPVENSTEGVVSRALDLLLASPLHIVGERSLAIRHNLLRASSSTSVIVSVIAHAQALAQCQAWLTTHLPNVERRAVASNAEGARIAAADGSVAAIAGEHAAAEYGLHVVATGIEDLPDNRTRFVVVADPRKHVAPAASGHDRTSVVVSVPNKPGAVHDLLAPLKQHGVSMTHFESRPARGSAWEYHFHIDVDGHATEPRVARALEQLALGCAFYRLLGTYPVDPT